MQSKTVKRVLVSKMNSWLKTIDDKVLREEVKDNLLVTGGSIASMFLNEDVNDYDVYIKDMDVLLKLAKYYCGSKVLDGRMKLGYLKQHPRFLDIYNNDGLIEGEGGELTKYVAEEYVKIVNLKEDQIRLDINARGELIKYDDESEGKYRPQFLSPNAISLSDDIQIVLRFNGTSEQIHKTFDYIHATNYFTFEEGLVLKKDALESLLTKSLKYQGSLYPLTSIIRMKKFLKRGFTMSAGEVLKMMFQVSELDLKDPNVLEEQLIGVDVAYFADLISLLRGGEEITNEYLSKMIDKVFSNIDTEDE